MRFVYFIVAVVLFSSCRIATADTYQYSATFASGPYTATAQFNVPSILTSITTVTDLFESSSSLGGPVEDVFVIPYILTPNGFSYLEINEAHYTEQLVFDVPIERVGTFSDVFGLGTLAITDVQTPEPSSFSMLGTGLFLSLLLTGKLPGYSSLVTGIRWVRASCLTDGPAL